MMLISVTYLHYIRDYSTQLVEHFEKHLLPETELNIKIHSSNPNYCNDILQLLTFSYSLIIMYLLVLKLAKLEYPSPTINQLKIRE